MQGGFSGIWPAGSSQSTFHGSVGARDSGKLELGIFGPQASYLIRQSKACALNEKVGQERQVLTSFSRELKIGQGPHLHGPWRVISLVISLTRHVLDSQGTSQIIPVSQKGTGKEFD